MKKNNLSLHFVLILILLSSCAGRGRDLGQMVADQHGSRENIEKIKTNGSRGDFHSSASVNHDLMSELYQDDGLSYGVPSFDQKESQLPRTSTARSSTIQALGAQDPPENYHVFSSSELHQEVLGTHKYSFRVSYVFDSYQYQDERGIYSDIFKDSSEASENGLLILGFENLLYDLTQAQVYWLVNMGVGLNRGKGFFVDETESDAVFSLWMIPVDAGLGLQLNLANWIKLSASGGVSAMGLIQNRSDLDSDRRQVSLGHFQEGRASVNISRFFPRSSYKLYNNQDVTSYYLSLYMRSHNYQNFKQEDFKISGQSLGVGFTFEFL